MAAGLRAEAAGRRGSLRGYRGQCQPVQIRLGDGSPKATTSIEVAPHVAIGGRRAVSKRSDLGVRAELDRIDGELLLAVRALDYRYRFRNPLALTFFVGAARYDLATPAYGYYLGAGVQWRDILRRRRPQPRPALRRQGGARQAAAGRSGHDPRPDRFYDISGATLSLSYRF